ALVGLLYTIVLLFALQGDQITQNPWTVARLALPLLSYFVGMLLISLLVSKIAGMNYARSASVSFTAAGNNFEVAIAVAIGTVGASSGQALAGTIGPWIEVPVLVGLVYVMLWLGPELFPSDPTASRAGQHIPTYANVSKATPLPVLVLQYCLFVFAIAAVPRWPLQLPTTPQGIVSYATPLAPHPALHSTPSPSRRWRKLGWICRR